VSIGLSLPKLALSLVFSLRAGVEAWEPGWAEGTVIGGRVVMVLREWSWSWSGQDSDDRLIMKQYQEGRRSIWRGQRWKMCVHGPGSLVLVSNGSSRLCKSKKSPRSSGSLGTSIGSPKRSEYAVVPRSPLQRCEVHSRPRAQDGTRRFL
jgi:hypothetical protein